jgi:hypothetical protein
MFKFSKIREPAWTWTGSEQTVCYFNITITILDIIHPPVFYLIHGISETGLCLHLHVEHTQFGPNDRASLCLLTQASQSQRYNMDDGQLASLSAARDQFFFSLLFNIFRQLMICWYGAPSLMRADFVVYSSCWASPAWSFSGPSPAGLMLVLYCF